MSYVNADEFLPEDLVREIQRYVDGKVLYVRGKMKTYYRGVKRTEPKIDWQNGIRR